MDSMTHHGRIAGRLAGALAAEAAAARAVDVRIGLGYTAVKLDDGRAGLAYTFRDEPGCTCTAFDDGAPLAGRPAAALLGLTASSDPIAAAVGFACANALANVERAGHLEGDVLDHLGVRPDDRVGMVGQFRPVLRGLKGRCRETLVFERVDEPRDGLLPAARAPELLPGCQVAFLTATSLVNGTVDGLLEMVRGCREVAIVGATTPLFPAAFEGSPVTLLSGVVVVSADGALRVVSEGGGTPALSPFTRKVSLRLVPAR